MKRLLFGSVLFPATSAELALLALRVYLGLAMAFGHGLGKIPPSDGFVEGVTALGFPAPIVFAWAAGLAEAAGGALMALGLLTRPSAFFMAFTMAVAGVLRHAADPFKVKELAFTYLCIAIVFVVIGGGRFSVDRFFRDLRRDMGRGSRPAKSAAKGKSKSR